MQTDGGSRPQPTDLLEARLARRFELHLADAQRDYPRLRWPVVATARASSTRRRLGIAATALVLIVAALVASQLPAWRSSTLPAASPTGPTSAPSGVTMGSDGIPVSIDGAHVFRPEDVMRGTATGTFLVGGRVEMAYPSCPPFASGCDPYVGLFQGVSHIGIKGLPLQPSWESAVVRGTLDPSCPPTGEACLPTVVAQSVVWSRPKATPPLVADRLPLAINADPVFRPAQQQEWQALGGSFLLAGIAVDRSHPIAACPTAFGQYPMYPPQNDAEARLLPVRPSAGICDARNLRQLSLDGTTLDLAQSPAALPDGHLVVLRVHTHDPVAAQCSAEYRSQCESAIVVEAVVWDTGRFVELGPDGLPTAIGVDTVYRAAGLPTTGTVLLAGRLVWSDTASCIAPAGQKCGPWTIDGLVVTDGAKGIEGLDGKMVAARVAVEAPQSSASSPTVSLIEIVWQEPASRDGSAPPS